MSQVRALPSHSASTTSSLMAEFQPKRFIPNLTSGLVLGLLSVMIQVSFAALIYSGELSSYVAAGVGLLLAGNTLLALIVVLFSSNAGSIALGQDAPAAILAVMVAAGLSVMPPDSQPETKFASAAVLILVATLSTGLIYVLLGYFRLGSLVRFLPYPVIGGFLAGTGWLLLTGGIGIMVDIPLNLGLFSRTILPLWLTGLALAVVLLWALNRYSHFLILPGMLLGAILLFYTVVWVVRIPHTVLSAQGWLLGALPMGSLWRFPLEASSLALVDWSLILGSAGELAPFLIINLIALLLNASSIELVSDQDIDINKELRVAGLGNLASGLVGGIAGYHALSLTGLNRKMTGGSRLSGLFVALVSFSSLILGASLISLVPKFVFGGLVAFLGLSFLYDWLLQAWRKLPRVEFLITSLIFVVIALIGFLEGVATGITAAVILFVIEYSRIGVVKHSFTGASYRSRVNRSRLQQQILARHSQQLYILQLQGYIFFGTASGLLDQVRQRLQQPGAAPLRYLILDFNQVTRLDSTAIYSLTRMVRLAHKNEITLVLSSASPGITDAFARAGLIGDQETLQVFPDLDHGVEWCENQLLETANALHSEDNTLQEQLGHILAPGDNLERLLDYLEKQLVEPATCLIRQGDKPDYIYFIESGQVTSQLEAPDRAPIRMETMGGGSVVGEIGFYLGVPRSASVLTDSRSTVYVLSRERLAEMERSNPQVALAFHRIIIHLLSERLVHLTNVVEALQR